MKIVKIFVTGATGFIGSNLVRGLIKNNYKVYALIRKNSKTTLIDDIKDKIEIFEYDGDINNLVEYFKEIKPDVVIHLASLFLSKHNTEDIENLIKSNILFGTQILEAMIKSDTKNIINTSTSWQHYNNEQYNPVCLYAATKQAFEDILKFYVEAYKITAVNLTIFDSYGAFDIRNKIIKKLYEILHTGETLNMSGGEQFIDLIYIKDIVEAYLTTIRLIQEDKVKDEMKKYYLNSNNPLRLKDAVKVFEEVNNKKVDIKWGMRPYREREVMETYKLGERLPNWEPKYSLKEGLTEINKIMEDKTWTN